MKPTKRITSLILVSVLCLSLAVLFAACRKAPEEIPETSVTETTKRKKPKPTTEIHIEEPTEAPTQKETTTKTQPTTKTPTTTKAPSTTRTQPTTKAPSTTRQPSTTKPPATTKAPTTTQPTTQKPTQPTTKKPTEPTTEKPVTTTKQDVSKAYSCGNSRHHCKTPEDHAFITSLEAKGCPTCGSHSCKSFYCTDQWGNPSYNQSKCPQYGVKDDPLVYCSTCGKKVGTGDKGTCVRFTVDTVCPICHKEVPARTCHSH